MKTQELKRTEYIDGCNEYWVLAEAGRRVSTHCHQNTACGDFLNREEALKVKATNIEQKRS